MEKINISCCETRDTMPALEELIFRRCTDNTSPYAHKRTFFSLRTPHEITRLAQGPDDSLSRKVISSLVISLLKVLSTPFLLIFSSPTTTQTPLTGIRLNPCPTLLWGGPSGHLASPTSNTEDEEEVTGLLFFCWLALKRQKRESDENVFVLSRTVDRVSSGRIRCAKPHCGCSLLDHVQVCSSSQFTEMCFVFLCLTDVE